MAVWSSLRGLTTLCRKSTNFLNPSYKRYMSGGHNTLKIEVSRWQWHKFKDLVHLYTMIGVIPASLVIFYVNVFIGPATLTEIPEGYTPKHWEYHRHPITRFIARYLSTGHQQEYEKYMHYLYEEDEKRKMRMVTKMVKDKMRERHDYEAYYYRPVTAKYFRFTKDMVEETKQVIGEN